MTNETIIRAWKDEGYHSSLSDDEKRTLPPNPAGIVAIADHHLEHVGGETTAPCGAGIWAIISMELSCFPWCNLPMN